MSIYTVLNQIKNHEVVLPAIQRDFVWSTDKLITLLDSVMRGYPIGIGLMWETYENIQYRHFDSDFKPGSLRTFHDNTNGKKLRIVLDGQQRLQSLYIALYGTYEGRRLYFDVLSGIGSDELAEEKFHFRFANNDEELPIWTPETVTSNGHKFFYVRAQKLFTMGALDQQKFKKRLTSTLELTEAEQVRLDLNVARFNEAFAKDENILRTSVIDENLPKDSAERKTEADVLEVFVRINTQGTPLKRSDLVFSLLKLNWKESAETLPEFVSSVNKGNDLGIDNDFVIRCLLAVSELGTKFDLEQLRNKQKIEKLKNNFPVCCDAIRAAVDFVTQECRCHSSGVIGGLNTIVPFVYYLCYTKKHTIKNTELTNVKKAFYLLAFARPFSRYGDSRLWAFIREELVPRAEKKDEGFPYGRLVEWIRYWEKITGVNDALIQSNVLLALHLLQGLTGSAVQYEQNEPHIDHIFPRSILRDRGFDEMEINHFANFWVLAKNKNLNKSNTAPNEYFANVSSAILKQAAIELDLLHYRSFRRFLRERRDAIIDRIKQQTQLSDEDFQVAAKA